MAATPPAYQARRRRASLTPGPPGLPEGREGGAAFPPQIGRPLRDGKAPEGADVACGPAEQVVAPWREQPSETGPRPAPPVGRPGRVEERQEIDAFAGGREAPGGLPGEDSPRALTEDGVRTDGLGRPDRLEGGFHEVGARRGTLARMKGEEKAAFLHTAGERRVGEEDRAHREGRGNEKDGRAVPAPEREEHRAGSGRRPGHPGGEGAGRRRLQKFCGVGLATEGLQEEAKDRLLDVEGAAAEVEEVVVSAHSLQP